MDLDDFSQNVESLLAELAATEAQRARYQALFELAPDPAILTDRGGAIAEVNRAAARLLDAAPAALVGAKLAGIMRPSVSLPDEGRTLLTWQGELQPPGGAGFPATACAVIVPDEQGRPVYWRWSFSRTSDVGSGRETPESTKTPPERHLPQTVAQFEDKMAGRTGDLRRAGERLRHELSERQQAEARLRASEGRFRSIYEYSAIGIGLLDESGHLLDVNPAGLAMFGIADPAQIRSLNLFEASNVLPRLLDRLRRGESVRYEAPLDFAKVKAAGLYDTTRSGVRRMEFIVTPIGAPQPGFLVQVQDMTERVRAGELSQALNAINAAINATFDVEQVLAEVAYTAQEALAADSAIVTVQEPDGGWRIRSVVGLPIEIVGRVLNAAEVPYSTLAAQTHTPIVVPNIDNTSPGLEQLAAVYGVCAALITPLALRQDVIGAFIFNYHAVPLALTERELDFACKLSAAVSMALENARLYQQTRYEQARWLATVESMLDPVTVCDAQGHAIYMNQAYSALLNRHIQSGLALERHPEFYALYRPDGTLFPPEELPLQRAALRNEAVREVELMQISGTGAEIRAIYSAAPLHDEAGRVIGAVAVGHDVTEQRRMEAERESLLVRLATEKARLDAVLQQMPAGVTIAEAPGGRLILDNDQMARIWRKPTPPAGSDPQDDYYRGFHRDGHLYRPEEWPIARAVAQGEVVHEEEIEIKRGDGSHGIVLVNASPICDDNGQIIAGVTTFFDVTERMEMQAALRRARDELERRVQERTAALDRANQGLRGQAEALVRSARRLQLLSDIDQAALGARSAQEIARLGAGHLRRALSCRHVSIAVFNPSTKDALILAADAKGGAGLVPNMRLALADFGAEGDQPPATMNVIDDLQTLTAPTQIQRRLRDEGGRSFIQAPLLSTQPLAPMGALTLTAAEPGTFTPETVDTAREVANSLAVALENERLNEQVRRNQQQLQSLFRRLIQAQEHERYYVADQLHNNASQRLAALKLALHLLEQGPDCPAETRQHIGEMREITGQVLLDLHDLGVEMWPPSLEHLGIVPAIDQFIESFKRRSGLSVHLSASGWQERRLPRETEVTLYRALQEALNNVLRHAQATHVKVMLDRLDKRVVGIVEDDGVGFEPAVALGQSRLGLFGTKERIEMAGGELIIESQPGAGTTFLVELPIG